MGFQEWQKQDKCMKNMALILPDQMPSLFNDLKLNYLF